jgi:hypothetical protein
VRGSLKPEQNAFKAAQGTFFNSDGAAYFQAWPGANTLTRIYGGADGFYFT